MNTKGNQRAVRTEQKIKGVFLELLKEKDMSRISVSEICSRAEIHRTSFYVHYQDVQDLMEHLIGEMYEQIMSFFWVDGKMPEGDGFLQLFEMVREHREFFKIYLEAPGRLILGYDFLPQPLKERVDELVPALEFESPEELYYHQTFFCEGLSAIIRRWIGRDCKETPEQMRAIIAREYSPKKEIFQ